MLAQTHYQLKRSLLSFILVSLLSHCAYIPFYQDSLYDRLGGMDAITAVVDDLINNIVEDDRINHFFANSDLDEFKGLLSDQICEAAGGPCVYKGADMLSSHEGLEIRESDFSALVENLIKTLDKFAVPETEKNELLALLGSMQNDIVEPEQSLYKRLGGIDAIKAVVDDMTNNVVADDRINHFFANSDLDEFKGLLVDQICEATGGPCVYKGADMLSSHEGLEIRESDFTALVENLIKTLDKFSVPETERNELLTFLGSLKNDIVEPDKKDSAIKPVTPLLTEKQSVTSLKPASKIVPKSIKSVTPQSTKRPTSKKTIKAIGNVSVPAIGRVKGLINILGASNKKKPPNDAIIVLESMESDFKFKKVSQQSHVVEMEKKVYRPALISIKTNDSIAFHNLDKIKHNVFSVSKGASFDLGTYRAGKRPAIRFKKTGLVKVYCNIHPKMATFIMVTDSPFHQVTKTNGSFDFQAVPVGKYKLSVWSIRGNLERIIEVKENQSILHDITLNTSQFILKPHLNKKGLAYPKKPKRIDSPDDDEEDF